MKNNVVPKEQLTALDIIEQVDTNSLRRSLQAIGSFQQLVRSQFKQNHDFGVIPGTGNKPTLLKPGAEKIVMLLGLTSEYEVIESTRDFEKGFFQYQIKCKLIKNGTIVTEGMGAANTKERKYLKQDPFSVDNTVLKMAKKRALVDAALLVGSLSDIFTQDIEDMDLHGESTDQKRYYTDQDGTISTAQAKRIYAIAKGEKSLIDPVMEKYGYKKSEEIKKTDYDAICAEVTKNREVFDKMAESGE